MTAAHGIVNIYIEDIESQKDAKSDVMRVNIKSIEWTPRPKEPVIKKAKAAPPDPVAAMVAVQVQALNDQFKANAPRPV
jgi:hypothetical protein